MTKLKPYDFAFSDGRRRILHLDLASDRAYCTIADWEREADGRATERRFLWSWKSKCFEEVTA